MLILTKRYPPHWSPGAQRMQSFVRHLHEFGWEARVLTPKREALKPPQTDAPPAAPGDSVGKTEYWDYRVLEDRISRMIHGTMLPAGLARPLAALARTVNRVIKEFLLIPDKDILWAPFGLWEGMRILRRHRVDCILATAPPHSVGVVGALLSFVSGKPLVADFRDPWVGEHNYLKAGAFKRFMERRLERLVVRRARLITMTTRSQVRDLSSRHPGIAERCIDLPNGIESSWQREVPRRDADPSGVQILHSGQIYRDLRNPSAFFRAVRLLLEERPELHGRMTVTFAGPGGYGGTAEFADFVRQNELQDVVRTVAWLPPEELTSRLLAADVLLLLQNSALARTQLPSKVFHYAWSGRPILAIAPAGSETAEFVRSEGLGVVAEEDDPAVIRDKLLEVLELRKAFHSTFDSERFSRRAMSERLARHLARLIPLDSGGEAR